MKDVDINEFIHTFKKVPRTSSQDKETEAKFTFPHEIIKREAKFMK